MHETGRMKLAAGTCLGLTLLAAAACSGDGGKPGGEAIPGSAAFAQQGPAAEAGQEASAGDSVELGVQRIGVSLAPAATGKTVAVLQFPDLENRSTQFGKSIAERVTTSLVQQIAGKGSVVERGQVDQVLEELNLVGEISTRDAAAAGQQLGADVVVVGTTAVMDGRVVVNARAVSVVDGRVLAADGFTAKATADVDVSPAGPQPVARPVVTPLDSLLKLPAVQTAHVGSVQFQSHGCARTGGNLICALTVLSSDIDMAVSAWTYDSSISDDRGNTVAIERVEFGRERPASEGTLVAGVPTPAAVVVNGLPLSAASVTRLSLRMQVQPTGQNQVTGDAVFRSLPIIKP